MILKLRVLNNCTFIVCASCKEVRIAWKKIVPERRDCKMLRTLKFLMLISMLCSCSTMPTGPSVLVLPGNDKDFDQFHADDVMCRRYARELITSSQKEPDSKEEGQQGYDIGYIQCMYGKGHQVPVEEEMVYEAL
jgi:hypothetical protein